MVVRKDYRGKGIAVGLTKFATKEALKQGYKKIWMQAQLHATKTYEKAGFKVTSSKPYDLWNLGIPHVNMEYIVNKNE
jgi:predicted GNAT family N-acyltransferase